jgi:hypothetical protein
MSTMEPMEPETINVTSSARSYLEALESYGLLEGEPGQQQLSDSILNVLNALHHVLGGGTVSIEVRTDGSSSIVDHLDTAMRDAIEECERLYPQADIHCF